MKVNFAFVLTDLKNRPIKDGTDDDLTLAGVVCSALLTVMQSDENVPAAEKMRMFRLAQKASDGGEQDVSVEDVAMLKDRVAKLYGALIVGRVFDHLEGH